MGALLDVLADHARAQRVSNSLASHLHEQAGVARKLGAMADKQMRQEPLTAGDYKMLETFGGLIEHPYLLFKSVLWHSGGEGGIFRCVPSSSSFCIAW